jgi:hypothetical protein
MYKTGVFTKPFQENFVTVEKMTQPMKLLTKLQEIADSLLTYFTKPFELQYVIIVNKRGRKLRN